MHGNRVNCNAGQRYFGHVRIPVGDLMREPVIPGTILGLEVRIAQTHQGPAIDPALAGMIPAEFSPDLFVLDVSQLLHQTHLLPLGRGAPYVVIWSMPGVADFLIDDYTVWDETVR